MRGSRTPDGGDCHEDGADEEGHEKVIDVQLGITRITRDCKDYWDY